MISFRFRIESRENDVACDYVLAVDVVFYFSFSCEFSCRENEVRRLISTLKTMKNRLDSSWTFSLIASRDFPADVRYQPKEIRFCSFFSVRKVFLSRQSFFVFSSNFKISRKFDFHQIVDRWSIFLNIYRRCRRNFDFVDYVETR